jgi:valyl-tRNA synthetase
VIATGVSIPDQNNSNYLYSIDYGPFQTSNVFTNVGFGWHDITVQDINGCLDTTIEAFVINYPRFFTPNGDGQNDTWNIFSLRDVNPTAKIYIFDRYGKFIKQISPLGVGWDGTFNGEALPSTDYWFSVEYEEQGEAKVFKAHFSLKR